MRGILVVCALAAALTVSSSGARASGSACPASNSANEIVLAGGSGQTAQLGKPFPAPLQVRLANTNDCPLTGNLAGYNVTFDAPGGGASGLFAGSGTHQAVVGTDANGAANAPSFTANFTAGSYTVYARSDFGTIGFALSNTAAGLSAAISAGTGTPQQATVNSQYAQPLQARVTDANGNPVQGAAVTFSIVPGSTGAGANFVGGGPSTAMTDSNGIATSSPLLANSTPGTFTAVASTNGVSGVATFSLDNHATTRTLTTGDDPAQASTVGTRFGRPLTVRCVDSSGQPLEGTPVTFTLGLPSGGGGGGTSAAGASFLDGSSQATVLTDQNGRATSPPFVADGTPGVFTATASTAGATSQVRYRLRNLPARLRWITTTEHATVGHRYRSRPAARVTDQHGRPVGGASVTFTVGKAANGATASFPDGTFQTTVTSGTDGRVVAPALEANTTAGAFAVVAAMSGGVSIRYTLDNRAGVPAAIAVGAGDGQSTSTSTPLPVRLAVTVTDADGNPVAGRSVVFTAPAAGPSGAFTTYHRAVQRHSRVARVATNDKGIAVAPPFVANSEAGGYAVTVRAGAVHAAFALVNGGL
jgi:hypothetical protein